MTKVIYLLALAALVFGIFLSPMPAQAYELDEPELIEPIDGDGVHGDEIEFVWEIDEDEEDIEKFRLQVYEDDNNDLGDRIFDEYIDSSDWDNLGDEYSWEVDIGGGWQDLDLDEGNDYWWRVKAYADDPSDDDSDWSDEEDFRWYDGYGGGHGDAWIEVDEDDIKVEPGASITIYGDGWHDDEDIELYFDGSEVKSFTARDDEWEKSIRIPCVGCSGWSGYGMRRISADGDWSGRSNYIWVDVQRPGPMWELFPREGYTDTEVEAWGEDWRSGETVIIRFGGYEVDSCKVASDGEWKCSFELSDMPPGRYMVTAQSQTTDREEVGTIYFQLRDTEEDEPEEVIVIMQEPEDTDTGEPEAPVGPNLFGIPMWAIGIAVAAIFVIAAMVGSLFGWIGSLGSRIRRNDIQHK